MTQFNNIFQFLLAITQTGTHNDHQLSTTISTLGPTCFDDASRKNMSCMGDQSSGLF